MRILFFINGLAAGGKERRLLELMKSLKLNSEIDFEIALMNKEIHFQEFFDLEIKTHYLIRKSKRDFSVFFKLSDLCKKYKPDIIHCWDSMTAMYSAPICKLLRIKLVNGMVIGSPDSKNILNNVYRRAKLTFPLSNIIVGNSQAGLKAYNAPQNKSVCIYNGFNFDRLSHLESKAKLKHQLAIKSSYLIGMVASFSKYKDYKTFFLAAQLLLETRNDITFLAVGLGTDSEQSKKLIQTKYLKHFKLLGKRQDIESLISIMDICILSTFTEGISNSILEYMALGKPVIATDGGGTKEILVNGETGFLITKNNPQELCDKMKILIEDTSLCLKMGEAAKKRILTDFSIDKMVKSYISVYTDLYNN